MLFSRENFYFSQKIHYKHENLKYLNNFHTFLGLQKAKFDSLYICDKVASKSPSRRSMFIYRDPFDCIEFIFLKRYLFYSSWLRLCRFWHPRDQQAVVIRE